MVRNVVDTEDFNPKHGVEKRASNGMLRHLMLILEQQKTIPIKVWNRIIAETQMVSQQFGVILQMQLQGGNIVTQWIMMQV